MRKIFLDNLPKRKRGDKEIINWKNSIGYKCKFIYDDIEDEIEIIEYHYNAYITFLYNGNKYTQHVTDFKMCRFGKILNKITLDFKINIGDMFKDDKRNLIIIDRKLKKDNQGHNWKWYKYKCSKCNNEDWILESSLLHGTGCNVCCSYHGKVLRGYNDIATTDPWMVKYFVNIQDAYKYSIGTHEKCLMKCPYCGKEKMFSISKLHDRESISCECSDGISYPEKIMINILNQLNIKYIREYKNKEWSKEYRYDFYINDNIIELHGLQHYEDSQWKTFEEQHNIDLIKKSLAINNITGEYIEVDCRISDLNYIKNSFINNEKINKILNLSDINWIEADKFASKNLVKEISDYYEEHKNKSINLDDIGKIFNISSHSVRRYLKIGKKFGWNTYNVNDTSYSKVKCIETGKVFNSIAECAREMSDKNIKLNPSNISAVCTGKVKTHKGYHFEYVQRIKRKRIK